MSIYPILCQMNPGLTLTPYLYNINLYIYIHVYKDVCVCVCVCVCLFQHNSGTPEAISTKFGTHMTICMYINVMYILIHLYIYKIEFIPFPVWQKIEINKYPGNAGSASCNIIIPSNSRSRKRSVQFRDSDWKFVCVSHLYRAYLDAQWGHIKTNIPRSMFLCPSRMHPLLSWRTSAIQMSQWMPKHFISTELFIAFLPSLLFTSSYCRGLQIHSPIRLHGVGLN
jgi:hypothetical protein